MLTVARITNTLLGEGSPRTPTEDFWRLFRVWRKTLSNTGGIHQKGDLGWVIHIDQLSPETLDKACAKSTFKSETRKAVNEAIDTLRVVFADDSEKMAVLERLTD